MPSLDTLRAEMRASLKFLDADAAAKAGGASERDRALVAILGGALTRLDALEGGGRGVVTIETRRVYDGAAVWFVARPVGDEQHTGGGRSEQEAVGALVTSYPEIIGVVITRAIP